MKNLGCNKVTCGQKATYKDYSYMKRSKKYNFKIENEDGERKIIYSTQHKNKWQPKPKEEKQIIEKDKYGEGCGFQFEWNKI